MSIYVDVYPDPPLKGSDSETRASTSASLSATLRAAYLLRLTAYEKDLGSALGVLAFDEPNLKSSHYPQITLLLDEGEKEILVFNADLYADLLNLYALYGWKTILQIEEALDQEISPKLKLSPEQVKAKREQPSGGVIDEALDQQISPSLKLSPQEASAMSDMPSGGVRVSEWLLARSFFYFTRNLVALMIREELIRIERAAANLAFQGLNQSANLVSKAWLTDFGLEKVAQPKRYIQTPSINTYVEDTPPDRYRMKNRPVSDALFSACTAAVKQKFAYEEFLLEQAGMKDYVEKMRDGSPEGNASSPGYRSPYPGELAASEKAKRLENLDQVVIASKELLDKLRTEAFRNFPLALLILDSLPRKFDQPEMENSLGTFLAEFYGQIDEIAQAVDPKHSRIEQLLPGLSPNAPITVSAICNLKYPPRMLIEDAIIDASFERVKEDPGYMITLNESIWHQLVESRVIEKDTFAYIVYFHYVFRLMEVMEAKRNKEEEWERLWKGYSKAAAALSLASFAIPQTWVMAPVLLWSSLIADLVSMLYAGWSVYEQLSRLDKALSKELIQPGGFALQNIGRLGELRAFRQDIIQNLKTGVFLELLQLAAGHKWGLMKRYLLARGFYSDLETLGGR